MALENRQIIYDVALRVRDWAEDIQEKSQRYSDDLCGLCGIATGELWRSLRRRKINMEIHMGIGHVFGMINGYVIDVTATQFQPFRDTPILIQRYKKVKEVDPHGFYDTEEVCRSGRELVAHQRRSGWPEHQIHPNFSLSD